jgi:hypothetical protein
VDVVIGCSFRSYLIAKISSFGLPTRVIFWIHSIPLVVERRIRRTVFRMLTRNDTLIYISEAVRDAHRFPSREGRDVVVHYGIEAVGTVRQHDRHHLRRQYRIPEDSWCSATPRLFLTGNGILTR